MAHCSISTIKSCFASQLLTSTTTTSTQSKVAFRPVATAKLNSSSSAASTPISLIRNEPVFAAPAPIIHPLLKEDMGKDSYEEAIAALGKLLSENGELGPVAAARIDEITAELKTVDGSVSSSESIERLKTGFIQLILSNCTWTVHGVRMLRLACVPIACAGLPARGGFRGQKHCQHGS